MFSSYFFCVSIPFSSENVRCFLGKPPLLLGKTSAAFGEKVCFFWGKPPLLLGIGPHCLGTTSEPVTLKVWKFTC